MMQMEDTNKEDSDRLNSSVQLITAAKKHIICKQTL